jgi:hypothetical protein
MTNTTTNFTSFNSQFGKMARKRPAAITPTMDGDEALALAGLNWTVDQIQLSELLDVPNADSVVISRRSDTGGIVGSNGKQYNVIQNHALVELGDAIRQVRPDAQYVSGGEKAMGATTFIMLELSDGLDLGGGDTVRRDILISKSHNGGSLKVQPVGFRPFCLNQWTGLLNSAGKPMATVPHTATAPQRLFQAVSALQVAVTVFDEWDQALTDLLNTPTRAKEHFHFIAGVRPDQEGRAMTEWENRLDRLWAEYQQDFNANLIGTAAGVFMAAQGADEHSGRCGRNKRDEQRVGRMLTSAYPMAARALVSVAS